MLTLCQFVADIFVEGLQDDGRLEPDKFRPAALVVKGISGPDQHLTGGPICLKTFFKHAKGLSLGTEGLLPMFVGLKMGQGQLPGLECPPGTEVSLE